MRGLGSILPKPFSYICLSSVFMSSFFKLRVSRCVAFPMRISHLSSAFCFCFCFFPPSPPSFLSKKLNQKNKMSFCFSYSNSRILPFFFFFFFFVRPLFLSLCLGVHVPPFHCLLVVNVVSMRICLMSAKSFFFFFCIPHTSLFCSFSTHRLLTLLFILFVLSSGWLASYEGQSEVCLNNFTFFFLDVNHEIDL